MNINDFVQPRTRTFLAILILSLMLIVLFALPAVATRAGRETLRSQLYEQFRCGNGLCEVVETRTTCPEDCLPEPEEPNVSTIPSAVPSVQKRVGFESISGIIPSDDLFEPPQSPPQSSPQSTDSVSSSSTVSSFSSPPLSKPSTFGVILVVLLLIALGAFIAYTLRKVLKKSARADDFSWSAPAPSTPPDSPLPSSSPLASTSILARLIEKLRKKGLTAPEMYQRIKRMDVWDDQTLRRSLGL